MAAPAESLGAAGVATKGPVPNEKVVELCPEEPKPAENGFELLVEPVPLLFFLLRCGLVELLEEVNPLLAENLKDMKVREFDINGAQ